MAAAAAAEPAWDAEALMDEGEEERARRVEAALQTQMEMQRRLHQQLEVGLWPPTLS